MVPAAERALRPNLFAALEAAYPVRFEGRPAGAYGELDGVVSFGPVGAAALRRSPPPVPCLIATGEETAAASGAAMAALSNDPRLQRPLRGARLTETRVRAVASDGRTEVLARLRGAPAWTRRETPAGPLEVAAAAPSELGPDEALRERLWPGRSLALLPLAHFLAERSADRRWRPPRLRAAIVIDDPNLHWPTYGRVRYAELVQHAAAHGYHAAMAMIPLDGWVAHPRAARLFRKAPERLSLCIHGNDHSGPELGRPRSDAEALALALQALRRMDAFQRRSGIPVSRVMVPPHERLSEPVAHALRACGYEAVCTTRPYPWLADTPDVPPFTHPADSGPLAGWASADLVAGGLPVLLRSAFTHPREDLALRAFLGQPLILYGHHDELDDDLTLLADAAADIGRLGEVDWGPLDRIARHSVEIRREGATLAVRPLARRVTVSVPEGVERLTVDAAAVAALGGARVIVHSGARERPLMPGEGIPATGPAETELIVDVASRPPSSNGHVAHSRRLWPVARRVVSEGRDRLAGVRP